MLLRCVWEHNGEDTLLYIENLPGACARGPSLEQAKEKLPAAARSWLAWAGRPVPPDFQTEIVQEHPSTLDIGDADSDVLFDSERLPLTWEDYQARKALALQSAGDFLALYQAVPDRNKTSLMPRECFYGPIPRTAEEMYQHTKNVNGYYFGEIGVEVDNQGDILSCRQRGFAALEAQPDFLSNRVFRNPTAWGAPPEEWSAAKVLRRFLWHDRLHAKALFRMAEQTFGPGHLPDLFHFVL